MADKKPSQPVKGDMPLHKKLAMGQTPSAAKPAGKKTAGA